MTTALANPSLHGRDAKNSKRKRNAADGVASAHAKGAKLENQKNGVKVETSRAKNRRKKRKKEQQKERKRKREEKGVQLESEFRAPGDQSIAADGSRKPGIMSNNVVPVSRPEDVEKSRENLPIVMMEQEIMEAISENPVVLVCGETGCGKTTQVPQFLYEAGYGSAWCSERAGMIGVTQPRRVAVLATARRVAHELSVNLGQEVGFQIRHDRRIGEKSCIKFMTDGILLRELQADFLLRRYSVIVLDEAHERSLNTDILIGMLSRVIPLRQKLFEQHCADQKKSNSGSGKPGPRNTDAVKPLKLVIMSATLRVEDFTSNRRMFASPPPVLRVPARQFPVTVHFNKKTELLDYVGGAYKKVCTIHRKLPPGGILVFVTGQREVEDLCRKLRKSYQQRRNAYQKGFSGHPRDSDDKEKANDGGLQSKPTEGTFGGLTWETITAAVDEEDEGVRCHVNSTINTNNEEGFSDGDHFTSSEQSSDDSEEDIGGESSSIEEKALQQLQRALYPQSESTEASPVSSSKSAMRGSQSEKRIKIDIAGEDKLPDPKEAGNGKESNLRSPGPLYVLPLYAMLPAAQQLKVFSQVPRGTRLVVVATNVAETSITIPGVRYVVDCGRAKERLLDQTSGISKYEVQWISKASADQRAGRAGRTGPGHCYRLYSSAHFNNSFPQFALPEISKATIEGVVLVMKSMGIDKVANFPFPSPPEHVAMVEAERCLTSLSALSPKTGALTSLGRAMAAYPISPRHSRMLLAAINGPEKVDAKAIQKSISGLALAYSLAAAAVLSIEDPFLREDSMMEEDEGLNNTGDVNKITNDVSAEAPSSQSVVRPQDSKSVRRQLRSKARGAQAKFKNVTSDALSIANALRAYDHASDPEKFCEDNFIHAKRMHEMSQLRRQLWNLVHSHSGSCPVNQSSGSLGDSDRVTESYKALLDESEKHWNASPDVRLSPDEEDLVRQTICAGWPDKVARRLSPEERALLPEHWSRRRKLIYKSCSTDQPVILHASSSVSKLAPDFVVYNELVSSSETYMRGITGIDSAWLPKQAEALCTFSKPLQDPLPWYDWQGDEVKCWVDPSFGPHLWKLPKCSVPMKKGKHRAAVFAAALLQGKVLPSLSSLSSYLTNDPLILLKPESQALKRVSELIYRLGETVDSRAKLSAMWRTDRHFLYSEILTWIQANHQAKLKEIWDRLIAEAQLSGQELYSFRKAGR